MGTTAVDSHRLIQESVAAYRELLDHGSTGARLGTNRGRSGDVLDFALANVLRRLTSQTRHESALVVGAVLLAGWQFLTADEVAAITTLAIFLAAGSRIIPSMLRISTQLNSLASAVGAAESTYDILLSLSSDSFPTDENEGTARTEPHGLSMRSSASIWASWLGSNSHRVTFTYEGHRPAVVNVSLDVPPGTSLALVGSTGSGKSTLVDLMLGVLLPQEGSVGLSHYEPAIASRRWPGAIGYVPQNIALLNASIRENVALGFAADDILDDLVWEALDRAQLAEYLSSMREGLDTLVGERGVRLSGGQRQRLGLARALYSRPKLLMLDEATSALDAETESAISSAIRRLSGTVTVVTVAHRLATVQQADQVAFLGNGVVEACGTFNEVRTRIPQFDRQARLLGL